MGSKGPVVSFDDIIQAGREKRKHEALANEIFGRGRRASAPGGATAGRKATSAPSLASRVGIAKRTASGIPKHKANIDGQWIHDLHRLNNPKASRVSQLPLRSSSARVTKDHRLYAALQTDQGTNKSRDDMNIRGSSGGLTIRGAAGPFTVLASNFAPGTTASDIEASMASVAGEIISCRLISAHPTVIAEIVFPERAGADNVIALFNNQRADGRLLHVYLKQFDPTARASTIAPSGPRARSQLPPNTQREIADRKRREALAEVEDGRYGFDDDRMEDDVEGGLYSDNITPRGRRC